MMTVLYANKMRIDKLSAEVEEQKAARSADMEEQKAIYDTDMAESKRMMVLKDENAAGLRRALQASTDILTNTNTSNDVAYTGTPYKTYSGKVKALVNMYNGAADWGCMTAKNVIDVRAAFMIGRGVRVAKNPAYNNGKTSGEREIAFIKDFMEFNNIDMDAPQEWAIGSELEGKVLLILSAEPTPDYPKGMIRATHIPWNTLSYSVVAAVPNNFRYIRAIHELSTVSNADGTVTNVEFDLTEPNFVYRRFGGTSGNINETPPKPAFVIRHMQDLDKELWDWRKINKLFAAPTPVITVETPEDAAFVTAQIENKNWAIGKALVLSGKGSKFELIMWKGEGYTTLEKAVESYMQTISGSTGVPVHFLGYPNLLSNRATAENLLELIELSTSKERKIWISTYEELFRKAIVMHNVVHRDNMDPLAVTAQIPFTSSASLSLIEKVYLPMFMDGAMSLPQLLSYLSELDSEEEIKRIVAERAEKDKRETAKIQSQRDVTGNVSAGNRGTDRGSSLAEQG